MSLTCNAMFVWVSVENVFLNINTVLSHDYENYAIHGSDQPSNLYSSSDCVHAFLCGCVYKKAFSFLCIPWLMTSQPPQSELVSDAAAQVQEATDPTHSPSIYMHKNSTIICNPWCDTVIVCYIFCKHHTATNVWWISAGHFQVHMRDDNIMLSLL